MNIQTKLEDDTIFFDKLSPQGKIAKLRIFNSSGIYTVEDFINCKEADFPKHSRKLCSVMAQVFRHEYLGQDLIYDVILNKSYHCNRAGINQCYYDLCSIGIRPYRHSFFESFSSTNEDFSMENALRQCNSSYLLVNYFLDYIQKQKEKVPTIVDASTELTTLKIQLQVLVNMDQNLQLQINELQERIASIEKGDSKIGK